VENRLAPLHHAKSANCHVKTMTWPWTRGSQPQQTPEHGALTPQGLSSETWDLWFRFSEPTIGFLFRKSIHCHLHLPIQFKLHILVLWYSNAGGSSLLHLLFVSYFGHSKQEVSHQLPWTNKIAIWKQFCMFHNQYLKHWVSSIVCSIGSLFRSN